MNKSNFGARKSGAIWRIDGIISLLCGLPSTGRDNLRGGSSIGGDTDLNISIF